MLCAAKVGSNPESTVGLLSMAGRNARFLVTSTRDMGIVFSCVHDVKCNGSTNIIAAMQKAQLALKHRQNAVQRQRIVVFVSSPIEDPLEKLVQVGKKMKKNNVAVDIVNLGSEGDNESKIDAFIAAVNANDNSHALHIPSGGPSVSDTFLSSDVYVDRDAQTASAAAGGGGGDAGGNSDFPFGVDPAQDPELAMVLRISMEDERLRQEQVAREQAEAEAAEGNAGEGAAEGDASKQGEYDDDDDLYAGGKDKMEVEGGSAAAAGSSGAAAQGDGMEEDMDEETRRAIALSMTDYEAPKDDDKDKK